MNSFDYDIIASCENGLHDDVKLSIDNDTNPNVVIDYDTSF